MKEKSIAIIPARYQSKRFPGKPLAKILGKSLIQRTYENAKLCQSLEDIYIATDNEDIRKEVLGFGAKVIMTSPDCPTGTDRIIEALEKEKALEQASIIINIQGDEPCTSPKSIDKLIATLIKHPHIPMATPVYPLLKQEDIKNPSIVKCLGDINGKALYFSRSPIPYPQNEKYSSYMGHLGIYGFRKDFLKTYSQLSKTPLQQSEDLEQLKVLEHGYDIELVLVEEEEDLGVNIPEDIKKVEAFLCKQNTSS